MRASEIPEHVRLQAAAIVATWDIEPLSQDDFDWLRTLARRSRRVALQNEATRRNEHLERATMGTATLTETTSPTVLFDGASYLGHFDLEEGIVMVEALGHADEIADADTSAMAIALDSLGWSILEDTDGGPLMAGLTEHGHPLYAMTVATAGTGPSKNDLHRDSLAREVGAWKALVRRAGASVFF